MEKEKGFQAIMETIQKAVSCAVTPLVTEIRELKQMVPEICELKKMVQALQNQLATKSMLQPDYLSSQSGGSVKHQTENSVVKTPLVVIESVDPVSWAQVAKPKTTKANKITTNFPAQGKDKKEKENVHTKVPSSKPQSNPAYGLARKCQGFYPITSVDIKRVGAEVTDEMSEEEHFQAVEKLCVRDFLHNEMGVSPRVAGELRIKNVFYSKAGIATGILYAEFMVEEEVDIVKRYAKNLKTSHGFRPKLVAYIPQSLYNRYRAVEEAAFNYRKNDSEITTRIWIQDDFQLRIRKKGNPMPWSHIDPVKLTNLPPQDPKKVHAPSDMMDKRVPPTPFENLQPINSAFSFNQFNLLGEEEYS